MTTNLKKSISLILCFIIVIIYIISTSVSAYSVKNNSKDELKKKIITLTGTLENIFKDNMLQIEEDIKRDIISNDLDYEITMESYEEQKKPYKNLDYISLIAAYITIKEEYKKYYRNFNGIIDTDFINYDLEIKQEEITDEVIYPKFKILENGNYILDGYEYSAKEIIQAEYKPIGDGEYKATEETIVYSPSIKNVRYGIVSLSCITPEDLFKLWDVSLSGEIYEKFMEYTEKLKDVFSNDEILQSILIKLPKVSADENYVTDDMTEEQKKIISIAQTLIGRIPYQWGGKPTKAGYDKSWWTFENGVQKGLDCSGFVEWVFMTAGYPSSVYERLVGTDNLINSGLQSIEEDELQAGDVGMLRNWSVNGNNHIGIYVGNGLWIHCASSPNTVVVNDIDFKYFWRVIGYEDYIDITSEENFEKEIDNKVETVYYTDTFYTENDIYTLAQLISHEAEGEGLNGWIAVGEVVKNRIESSLFPNTLEEVIYQESQFSYVENIKNITPKEEIIQTAQMVLNGQIEILGNKDVLYFRNPTITDNLSVTDPVDWGTHKYFTSIGHHAFYTQE